MNTTLRMDKKLGMKTTVRMNTKFLWLSLCLMSLFCGLTFADIEGHYECNGNDPFMPENYHNALVIQKTGNTYKLEWRSINENYSGTGILENNVLSAVFSSHGVQKKYGVIVYNLDEKEILKGNWTYQFQNILGTETCKKSTVKDEKATTR